jgi:hypothetical protein
MKRRFSEDIRIFLFPEIKLYKWDSKYNVTAWRNLLEICKNNPDQNAELLSWTKIIELIHPL